MSALVFVICILSVNFCSAATLLANISPAEFSARYQYFIDNLTNMFGEMAATDYSKYLIRDVWQNPGHNDMYALFINEDYDSEKYNAMYLYAGNNFKDNEIYRVQICIENNYENLRDSFFLESRMALAALNVTDANSDRIYRVIDGLDAEYRFFDSTARKNICITKAVTKNSSGHEMNVVEIFAY